MAFNYFSIPLHDRFWYLGAGLSVALSHLITALSFNEVESLISNLFRESRSRLENLRKIDEKNKHHSNELLMRNKEIKELTIKLKSYQKVVNISNKELIESKRSMQNLLQELGQVKERQRILESRTIGEIGG